jgi:hypothetical protein
MYTRSHQEDVPEDQNGHKGLPDESITPFSGETSLAPHLAILYAHFGLQEHLLDGF